MSESPVEVLKELVTAAEGKLLTWAGKAGGTEAQVVATEGEGKPLCAGDGQVEEPGEEQEVGTGDGNEVAAGDG